MRRKSHETGGSYVEIKYRDSDGKDWQSWRGSGGNSNFGVTFVEFLVNTDRHFPQLS